MKRAEPWRAWSGLLGPALAALALTGCGGNGPYPVEGKVLFTNGAPARELAGYTVDFELESGEKKFSASGMIQEDGTFTVGTHKRNDGAMVGKHRVTLSPPVPDDDQPRRPRVIPERYGDFRKSGLEAEIKAQRNTVVLEVERVKR